MRSGRPGIKRILGIFAAALIVLCAASLLLSRYGLEVTGYSLSLPTLPQGFEGFRVVQLSDLHGSEFGKDNERLIEKVRAETPDIIVLTGDFLDEGRADEELPGLEALCTALSDVAPTYFVSGNHDWASRRIEDLAQALERAGVTYLRNEYVILERGGDSIVLAGVEDPNGLAGQESPTHLCERIAQERPGSFVILLGHRNHWVHLRPDIAADLIFCGHEHGGVVRLPFIGGLAGTEDNFLPKYEDGVFPCGRFLMVVSRGLGNSVPVPRFMNTPEILSAELHCG